MAQLRKCVTKKNWQGINTSKISRTISKKWLKQDMTYIIWTQGIMLRLQNGPRHVTMKTKACKHSQLSMIHTRKRRNIGCRYFSMKRDKHSTNWAWVVTQLETGYHGKCEESVRAVSASWNNFTWRKLHHHEKEQHITAQSESTLQACKEHWDQIHTDLSGKLRQTKMPSQKIEADLKARLGTLYTCKRWKLSWELKVRKKHRARKSLL